MRALSAALCNGFGQKHGEEQRNADVSAETRDCRRMTTRREQGDDPVERGKGERMTAISARPGITVFNFRLSIGGCGRCRPQGTAIDR